MAAFNKSGEKISALDVFGINDPAQALEDAAKVVFGRGKLKPAKFGISSIKIFKPQISIPTWLGIKIKNKKAPVYNFYNTVRPPLDEPFSTKVTFAKDFRGGQWTYDSHMGTDFAIPVGTRITACAPGRVVLVENRLDHGGLKIFIDHGDGLITSYAHLSRSLVSEGEYVSRGNVIALSGAAGFEILTFFPFVSPHLHLNVILDGKAIDPFSRENSGETAMWIGGNNPAPHAPRREAPPCPEDTNWNTELIENAISKCRDSKERDKLRSIPGAAKRAVQTINHMMFYNTLFSEFPSLYEKEHERRPALDLPFLPEDYDGVWFPY